MESRGIVWLMRQEVIAELEYLGGLMQDTFGVIGQSTLRDFDDLFALPGGEGSATVGTDVEGRGDRST
jgi:hypothetical protein